MGFVVAAGRAFLLLRLCCLLLLLRVVVSISVVGFCFEVPAGLVFLQPVLLLVPRSVDWLAVPAGACCLCWLFAAVAISPGLLLPLALFGCAANVGAAVVGPFLLYLLLFLLYLLLGCCFLLFVSAVAWHWLVCLAAAVGLLLCPCPLLLLLC